MMKAEAWYVANPKKQKRSHFRFLVNWMNKVAKEQKPYQKAAQTRDDHYVNPKEYAPPPPEWRNLKKRMGI